MAKRKMSLQVEVTHKKSKLPNLYSDVRFVGASGKNIVILWDKGAKLPPMSLKKKDYEITSVRKLEKVM